MVESLIDEIGGEQASTNECVTLFGKELGSVPAVCNSAGLLSAGNSVTEQFS